MNRAEAVAQVFIGTRINCAKCHDHPFENVSQDDYYRFAAIFDAIDYEIIENREKDGFDKHRFVGEQIIKLVSIDKFQNKFLNVKNKETPKPGFLNSDAGSLSLSITGLRKLPIGLYLTLDLLKFNLIGYGLI